MEIDKDKSPLTYEQWTRLEKLADAAKDALVNLQIELSLCATVAIDQENDPARCALLKQMAVIDDLRPKLLGGYWYHPQAQWAGGDRTNHREPHIVPGMCSATRYVMI